MKDQPYKIQENKYGTGWMTVEETWTLKYARARRREIEADYAWPLRIVRVAYRVVEAK